MSAEAKKRIYEAALGAKLRNEAKTAALTDAVSLTAYSHLVRQAEYGKVWTDALQSALREHEIITIPASDEVYWLDATVVIPSNRRIEAEGAVIRLAASYPYVMLRNEHTHDGTLAPIDTDDRDCNITIRGGSWEECGTHRSVRRYGDCEGFKGVQTTMLFNNVDHLTMTDMTFVRAISFCVQVGDLTDGVFENFSFTGCFADGLHINGNCENLYIRNFSGYVGDDLVALNMYDWLGSSINYGPARNVFCENIHSASGSTAKAMRLQPGLFTFADGTTIDCSLEDMYFCKISGIYEYKLYLQTPPYRLGEKPEGSGVGSADNLFFEDIHIIADVPGYASAEPGRDIFGMFILNSNIGCISLKNITYVCPETVRPNTYLIVLGPLSNLRGDVEIFDPYASGTTDTLALENITCNGKPVTNVDEIVKVVAFDDINKDGFSSGRGRANTILLDGRKVR